MIDSSLNLKRLGISQDSTSINAQTAVSRGMSTEIEWLELSRVNPFAESSKIVLNSLHNSK